MVPVTFVAAILAIIPAMGTLLFALRRFEGYFEQLRLFFAIGAGLVAGTALRYVEERLFPFDTPQMAALIGPFPSLAYTAVGFSMLVSLAFTAILGLKRFRGRKDTPFYGPALGAAFGSLYLMSDLTVGLEHVLPTDASWPLKLAGVLAQLALVTGAMLACAGAACWSGTGSAAGTLWRGMFTATLWLVPTHLALWLWMQAGHNPYWLAALGSLAYGFVVLAVAQRKALDPIVPASVRDQVRRERRRALRRQV